MHSMSATTNARRVAATLAVGGAMAVLACLYILPWWSAPACHDDCGFLGLASDWVERYDYASPDGEHTQRPFTATAVGTAFLRWGHIALAAAAVASVVALRSRTAWPLALAATLVVIGGIWLRVVWGEVGVINANVAARLAFVGAGAIAVAAVLRGLGCPSLTAPGSLGRVGGPVAAASEGSDRFGKLLDQGRRERARRAVRRARLRGQRRR